ncbi:conserved hypothetical protein, partial [Ricinus communis]
VLAVGDPDAVILVDQQALRPVGPLGAGVNGAPPATGVAEHARHGRHPQGALAVPVHRFDRPHQGRHRRQLADLAVGVHDQQAFRREADQQVAVVQRAQRQHPVVLERVALEADAVEAVQAVGRGQPQPAVARLRHVVDAGWGAVLVGPAGVIQVFQPDGRIQRVRRLAEQQGDDPGRHFFQ